MKLQSTIFAFRHPRLVTAAVASAVLGYCMLVGVFAGNGRNLLTLGLLLLPASILVCLFSARYFRIVVLLLPITALAVPFDLPTGTESKLPSSLLLTLFLTLFWCVSMMMRGWKLAPSPLNRPLMLFSAICIISLFWGLVWRDPVLIKAPKFIMTQTGALVTILLSICAALLVGNFVTTPGQMKYLVGVFIGFGSLMTLAQLFHAPHSFLNDGGLWSVWLVAPAYGVLIAQPRVKWRWRLLLMLIIVLTLYQTMVVNSDWLSGWVPTIVAIIAMTFLRSWKAGIALLLVGAIAGFVARDFFERVSQDNINDGSLERLSLWEENWSVVKDHWLFGTGPAGYAIYYMTYIEDARSTHNNYLDILSQFGFTGMLAWIWIAITSVLEGWKLVQRAPPGFLRTMAIIATGGWIAAMAAMLFGDWVLPFAYNVTITGYKFTVYSWLFFGTLISLRQLLPMSMPNTVQQGLGVR